MTNVGPDELDRRLRDHEARTDRIHAELDNRITRVAAESVPLVVWQQTERTRDAETQRLQAEHDKDLKDLKDDVITPALGRLERDVIRPLSDRVAVLEQRPQMTFGRWVAVAGLVVTFLGVLVTAWSVAKGAH